MNANGPSISSLKNARFMLAGAVLLLVAGCNSIGPKTIPRDRFSYSNDDWKSKRTFSSILFLFTLADSGSDQKMPTITIPAQ